MGAKNNEYSDEARSHNNRRSTKEWGGVFSLPLSQLLPFPFALRYACTVPRGNGNGNVIAFPVRFAKLC